MRSTRQIQLNFIKAFVFLLTINSTLVFPCTVSKITMYGKTMVGNNEDYFNPNTRIWFVPGKTVDITKFEEYRKLSANTWFGQEHKATYGAVYIGQNSMVPEGGINEAGLVFDLLGTKYKKVKNYKGKKEFPSDFEKYILGTCATVEEVKSILEQYDLRFLETSIWFFVDKAGKYLIIEGDSLIIGNDPYYIQSNFYPSCYQNLDDVNIPYYQKGRELLSRKQDISIEFCTLLMDTMHQDWGFWGTLYTSIYDLDEGIIYLYFNHNYKTYVKFNIADELKKGNRILSIPELFPENIEGHKLLKEYNSAISSIKLLDIDSLKYDSVKFTQLIDELYTKENNFRFEDLITTIGHNWLYNRQNIDFALQVFKLNVNCCPNSYNAYCSYAEAFMLNEDTVNAIKYYVKAIELNPDFNGAIQNLAKLGYNFEQEETEVNKQDLMRIELLIGLILIVVVAFSIIKIHRRKNHTK
jgi:tetratricopeptide (TPR) repeat protein